MNKLQTAITLLVGTSSDLYGYEITKKLKDLGLSWTHQQVYRELKKMPAVTEYKEPQDGKPDRTMYKFVDLVDLNPGDLFLDTDVALAFPDKKYYRVRVAESVYSDLINLKAHNRVTEYKRKVLPIQIRMLLDGISQEEAINLGMSDKANLIYEIVGDSHENTH